MKEKKNIPTNDDCFTTAIDKVGSPMHLAALHFSLCISNETVPYLVLFQAECPLAVFLFENLKGVLVSVMERFVKPEVLAKQDTVGKMLRLDLTDVNNLRAVENVKVGSAAAATLVCKKAKTTHAIGTLGQKIERKIPITLQIHSIHFFTLTNPNCCRKS